MLIKKIKAAAAERWNTSGLILFTSPKDYAPKSAGKVFPDGILMPSNGVQRGSLKLDGDLLTPGWSATGNRLKLYLYKT